MLRLGALAAATVLSLPASALAADPVPASQPQPLLFELAGKPVGYALSVASLDDAKVCGSKKLRIQVGTHMAPALAAFLSAPSPQGAAQTGSVYLAGGAQRMAFSSAKVVRVEIPVQNPKSSARNFFVVDFETQPTTCTTVSAKVAPSFAKQATTWASRTTTESGYRLELAGKQTDAGVTGNIVDTKWAGFKAEIGAGQGKAMMEWMRQAFAHRYESYDRYKDTLFDATGPVVEILARILAPTANGEQLELKADQVRICVFAEGQRICPVVAPAQ
ncbi:MAG: hypothetical protein HOO96_01660 [Polyangiaceae bacterium]|nr:hypothetical protein [Polyangiaceae bacterium]